MKSFLEFFEERNGHYLLNESYNRWVYHRTGVNPENGTFFKSGIDKNLSSVNYYGSGLYCTYHPADDFGYDFGQPDRNDPEKISHFENFGEYEIRGKVNYHNFLILDREKFKEITNKNDEDDFDNHLMNAGLFVDYDFDKDGNHIADSGKITDGIRYEFDDIGSEENILMIRYHDDWIKKGYSGCVFYTRQMGLILVIWDEAKFIPHSYRKSELIWDDSRGNFGLKDKGWIKVTPNIKNIFNKNIKPDKLKND